MFLNTRLARRGVVYVIGTSAVVGAMFASAPSALGNPAPGCTAGDLAQVSAGVSAGTSAYLFTHPWVNDYFSSLQGQPRDQMRTQVTDYLAANPREQAELQAIRQPMVDLRNRCGPSAGASTP